MLISFIALLIIVLDVITKKVIVSKLTLFDHIDVLPFLRIVHVENKGAAFGIFSNLGNNFFIGVSALAIMAILVYVVRYATGLEIYSFSLILGGAIGNLIDRLTIGKVIDFIDIFVDEWHWPAFNIADSALTIGIVLFIWANIKQIKKAQNK